MDNSVYQPPKSDLNTAVPIEIPIEISRKIKNGWIAAVISGVLTLIVTILAVTRGTLGELVDIWTSIDVVLIFILAFGIYKKSRTAATLMFMYFLLSKIWIIVETGKPSGIFMSLVFIYFYLQAMIGTYQYHKLIKAPGAATSEDSAH